MLARAAVFIYGIFCYVVFLATFFYALGFVGDLYLPKSIDSGTQGPLPAALLVDACLLGLFAVQHGLMARPRFKRTWTRVVSMIFPLRTGRAERRREEYEYLR
jgi:protein-S-isoprenylcysteine O-methyltransferase Ste14